MSTLVFEAEGPEQPPAVLRNSADLVSFMSFAVAYDYGSTHELAQLAQVLRRELSVRLQPLTVFYDADPEDEEDRERLERAWQEPGPLRETIDQVLAAFREHGQRLKPLTASAPGLVRQLEQLRDLVAWAEERGARVRLSYHL